MDSRSVIPKMRKYLAVNNPRIGYRILKRKIMGGENSPSEKWARLKGGYDPEEDPIYQRGFIKELGGYSPRCEYVKPFELARTDRILDKILYHDLRVYLPGLLHLEDRVSMALSIESRVPLLDYRIIEFLATVPPGQKVKNQIPKYLLREIASSLLPELVWKRKEKFPFPIPGKFWLMRNMLELTKKVLLSPDCMKRGIYEPQTIREVCKENDTKVLWWLLNVELWHKIFIDRDNYWLEKIEAVRKSEGIHCS
jgi:asparagine synthase (glutamine-hydrolysing)